MATTEVSVIQYSSLEYWNGTAWVSSASTNPANTLGATTGYIRLKPGAVIYKAVITDDDPYLNDASDGHGNPSVYNATTAPYSETTGAGNLQSMVIYNPDGSVRSNVGTFSADSGAVNYSEATNATGNPASLTYTQTKIDMYNIAATSSDLWTNTNLSNTGYFVFGQGVMEVGKIYHIPTGNWASTENSANYDNPAFSGADITIYGVPISSLENPPPVGVPCFVSGTMIETINGLKAAESLEKGDLVRTKNNGFKPIIWIGKKQLNVKSGSSAERHKPIRIQAGSLGESMPLWDLYVSPQHRVLVKSKIAQRIIGSDEVLVQAKHLTEIKGIGVANEIEEVVYVHFLFDQHEVVYSNGAETESLYTGPEALKALSDDARDEIMSIFPELCHTAYKAPSARIVVSNVLSKKLVNRHAINHKCLYNNTAN